MARTFHRLGKPAIHNRPSKVWDWTNCKKQHKHTKILAHFSLPISGPLSLARTFLALVPLALVRRRRWPYTDPEISGIEASESLSPWKSPNLLTRDSLLCGCLLHGSEQPSPVCESCEGARVQRCAVTISSRNYLIIPSIHCFVIPIKGIYIFVNSIQTSPASRQLRWVTTSIRRHQRYHYCYYYYYYYSHYCYYYSYCYSYYCYYHYHYHYW